jgi:hypothetical protein
MAQINLISGIWYPDLMKIPDKKGKIIIPSILMKSDLDVSRSEYFFSSDLQKVNYSLMHYYKTKIS